jgi:endonuclease/exonuclease/phosphatase family metal-dependent hydrolase
MPFGLLPTTNGRDYFDAEETEILRLSSKSHWDMPILVGDRTIHFLCAHPTPPVFDGPEDCNGRRNHDEIRFWADYIDQARSRYIYDDRGQRGGLAPGSHFIIAGDMNADPFDGDSRDNAIGQLLRHALINSEPFPASAGAREKSADDQGANLRHEGPSNQDTTDFDDGSVGNLRLDYVLTSKSLQAHHASVYWPQSSQPGHELVKASDHRLVGVDIELPQ